MRYHFIGIGGIGMSALAQVLRAQGHDVSGSDQTRSKTMGLLEKAGVRVMLGHAAAHVADAQRVVWSSAIPASNPELLAARKSGAEILHRAELLAEWTRGKRGIAVAGMHGKTTTTNMMFHVLRAAGMDPSLVSGGIDKKLGSNAALGSDPVVVFEADESDGTLALFYPEYAIITNLEEEHMAYYKDMNHIRNVFGEFASHVRAGGCVVICADDANCRLLTRQKSGAPFVSYSLGGVVADFQAQDIHVTGWGSRFRVREKDQLLGEIRLNVPGLHNVSNAMAVVALARSWGMGIRTIQKGLEGFSGTMRRLEAKGDVAGIYLMDDYAHHPTEIRASLQALAACRKNEDGKLCVVFQPHRYSRLKIQLNDFAEALSLADEVIITPVFSAGEGNPDGISSEDLARCMSQMGHPAAKAAGELREIATDLAARLAPGDMVMSMGAGDIDIFPMLMKEALLSRQDKKFSPPLRGSKQPTYPPPLREIELIH